MQCSCGREMTERFSVSKKCNLNGNILFVSLVEESMQIIFIATIKHSLLNEVIQQG